MLRIEIETTEALETLRLVGNLRDAAVAEVAWHLERSGPARRLDLSELKVVDLTAVRALVDWEERGVEIHACPLYVQEWMRRERQRRGAG